MVLVPSLSSAEMAELDRKMVEQYDLDILMMMENAGKALAAQARSLLGGSVAGQNVLVLAGKGNNGGGGLAAARHLYNWGGEVEVQLSSPPGQLKAAPGRQLAILRRMGIAPDGPEKKIDAHGFQLVIDALLGYNQVGNPRGKVAELVNVANSSGRPVLALDIPTGLNPDTGEPNIPCIKAAQTLTLAISKKGLLKSAARPYVGRLFLADISVPRDYYQRLAGEARSMFADGFVIEIPLP